LIQTRGKPGKSVIQAEFGQEMEMAWAPGFQWSLHSAGHIHGSSQILLSHKDSGMRLLYTGDFKMRAGFSCEKAATPFADVLIMETTFGLPRYRFPPAEETMQRVIRFCRTALGEGAVPVLLAYTLGKSQEILAGLRGVDFPLMLHPQTHAISEAYVRMGVSLPPFSLFDGTCVEGHAVICPPHALAPESPMAAAMPRRRTAVLTGWAMDSSTLYRSRCDAAFPLSDHADYDELLAFVDAVKPQRVYTVHGFVDAFARDLRARGVEAWALGRINQLEFRFA
jgi:Cft2 family RNA processing exonuclease